MFVKLSNNVSTLNSHLKQLVSYAKELEFELVNATKSKAPLLKEEISGLYRQAAKHCENRGLDEQVRSYLIKLR